jgi:presenilin-like A22 family membrane protease
VVDGRRDVVHPNLHVRSASLYKDSPRLHVTRLFVFKKER